MFSYFLTKAKDKVVGILGDFCPCLNPHNRKSHDIMELHRKSRRRHNLDMDVEARGHQGKTLTVETMKKLATPKMKHDGIGMQGNQKCFKMELCPWNSELSDTLLKVGSSVFPVHRFLLSIESEIFKTIIESIPSTQNGITIVTLNGYDADEIQMLLTFVYLPDSEIDDENVITLLKLSNELMIEELVIRCEDYLLHTQSFSPISLLQIAHRYQLPSLEESAAIKASKLPCIENEANFEALSKKQQEKVLNMSRNRYRSSGSMASRHTGDVFYFERTSPSPEIKRERELKDVGDELYGTLAFIPEFASDESLNGRTRT